MKRAALISPAATVAAILILFGIAGHFDRADQIAADRARAAHLARLSAVRAQCPRNTHSFEDRDDGAVCIFTTRGGIQAERRIFFNQ